jgi:hypothetical protein
MIQIQKKHVLAGLKSRKLDQFLAVHCSIEAGIQIFQGILGVLEQEFPDCNAASGTDQSNEKHGKGYLPKESSGFAPPLTFDALGSDLHLKEAVASGSSSRFSPIGRGSTGFHGL